jgi:ketosteroid isomerase-like protein
VYAWLIKRYVRRQFDRIGRADHAAVLRGVAENVHHRFAGDHALGGERHDKQALQRWFARLSRLCPAMAFEVHTVAVSGWPWDMTVAAEWSALVTPAKGPDYTNARVHVIGIRRGQVIRLFAYEDSQAVATACTEMAELGISEAAEPPIES